MKPYRLLGVLWAFLPLAYVGSLVVPTPVVEVADAGRAALEARYADVLDHLANEDNCETYQIIAADLRGRLGL